MTATIVIVEDNPMNMKLLEQALGIAGYRTVKSSDGEGLADLTAANDARLILMDIQLPKQSGVDLLKLLKADARTQAVPVVAVTAFADPDSVAGFLREGFDQVITKPISIRRLLDEVARYCSR
jgi:two-component system cell cycle response regulator DivK